MDVPIAYGLSGTAARAQLGEWRTLLATSAVATDRVSAAELSVCLRDDPGQIQAVIRLAQREKACCPFFDFGIRAEAITLHISVPEDAAWVLDTLAAQVVG
jgi:hypothetical protein